MSSIFIALWRCCKTVIKGIQINFVPPYLPCYSVARQIRWDKVDLNAQL